MASPIESINQEILDSIINIAPERASETLELVNSKRLEIRIVEDSRHLGAVATSTGEILLPTHFLEFLWFNTAFIVLINRELENCYSQKKEINFEETTVLYRVWSILKSWEYKWCCKWPSDLILPDSDCENVNIIKEAFLTSVSWIIHHELGHHELGHTTTTTLINREIYFGEIEADEVATTRILEEAPCKETLKKRSLGIICALLAIEEIENRHHRIPPRDPTHPSYDNRIMSNLKHMRNLDIDQEDSLYFRLPAVVLTYKEYLRGTNPPSFGANTSYREALSYILIHRAS